MTDERDSETADEAADSSRSSRFRRFLDATDQASEPTDSSREDSPDTSHTPSPPATADEQPEAVPEAVTESDSQGVAAPDAATADSPPHEEDASDPTADTDSSAPAPQDRDSTAQSPSASHQSSTSSSEPPDDQSIDEWEWLADPAADDHSADTPTADESAHDSATSATSPDDTAATTEDAAPTSTASHAVEPDPTDTPSTPTDSPVDDEPSSTTTPGESPASHASPADTAADTAPNSGSGNDRSQRVWNDAHTTTPDETSPSPEASATGDSDQHAPPVESPVASAGARSDTAVAPSVTVDPGESAFILSPTHSDAREQLIRSLLASFETPPILVVVRYRPFSEALLSDLVELTHRIELVSVGYAPSLSPAVEQHVSTTHITSTSDVTRLGIVVSQLLDADQASTHPTVFQCHAVDTLLQYRDPNTTFRFLHVLLGRLRSAEFTNHFFIDAAAVDDHAVNSLRPLFDSVVDTT